MNTENEIYNSIFKFIEIVYGQDFLEDTQKLGNIATELYYEQISIKKNHDEFYLPIGFEFHIRVISYFYFLKELRSYEFEKIRPIIKEYFDTILLEDTVNFYLNILNPNPFKRHFLGIQEDVAYEIHKIIRLAKSL